MLDSEDEFYGADSRPQSPTPQSSASQSHRNSFFDSNLEPAPPPIPLKTPALPRLNTSAAAESNASLPRGARLAQSAIESRINKRDSSLEHLPAPRPPRSSFFGQDEAMAQRERTQSGPSQLTQQHNTQDRTERRSSFYGLEGHYGPVPRRRNSLTQLQQHRRSMADMTHYSGRAMSVASSPAMSAAETLPSVPLLDHRHLIVGKSASLLSHAKTLELYRANAKKANDPDVTFEFATLMLSVAEDLEGVDESTEAMVDSALLASADRRRSSLNLSRSKRSSPSSSSSSIFRQHVDSLMVDAPASAASSETDLPMTTKRNNLMREAAQLLRKLANQGHVRSQYLLGDLHAQGTLSAKGKQEWDKAFPLFTLAAKHGHTDAAFKTAQCCEHALGCRRDYAKAVQWYKKACADTHPEAMFRLGMAGLKSELGLSGRQKEGFKWLKRAAELADSSDGTTPPSSVEAMFELGTLHVKGIEHVVFVDTNYAAECWAKAAEHGHAKAAWTLGECYEYGRMGCPQDSALSIHYYNIAAQQDLPEACFALTAWYLIGSPGVLPQSDTEAYLWAKKAASQSLAKAEYAVGYFSETGMGTPKDMTEAMKWYQKAAEHGDQRAIARLKGPLPSTPLGPRSNSLADPMRPKSGNRPLRKSRTDSECIIC